VSDGFVSPITIRSRILKAGVQFFSVFISVVSPITIRSRILKAIKTLLKKRGLVNAEAQRKFDSRLIFFSLKHVFIIEM